MVSEKNIFHVFPIIRLWQIMTPPGVACMDPWGTVGKIYKEDHYALIHTQNMTALGFVVLEKNIFCLPIVSLCEPSVAMETTIFTHSATKRYTINPPTQGWLIKIGQLVSEIFIFEIVDDGRRRRTTDACLSYTLTCELSAQVD